MTLRFLAPTGARIISSTLAGETVIWVSSSAPELARSVTPKFVPLIAAAKTMPSRYSEIFLP